MYFQNSLFNEECTYVSIAGQLLFIFDSLNGLTNNAITGLNAPTNTIIKCLNDNLLFLGVYYLSRIPPANGSEVE